MHQDIMIHRLRITVDPNDSSYQPSEVVIYGGENVSSLRELKTVHIGPDDSLVTLLQDMSEVNRLFHSVIENAIWN